MASFEHLLGFKLDMWDYLTFGALALVAFALVAGWVFLAGLPGRIAIARKYTGDDVLIVVDVVRWDFRFRHRHSARITLFRRVRHPSRTTIVGTDSENDRNACCSSRGKDDDFTKTSQRYHEFSVPRHSAFSNERHPFSRTVTVCSPQSGGSRRTVPFHSGGIPTRAASVTLPCSSRSRSATAS